MRPGFPVWATGGTVMPFPEMEKFRRKREGLGRKMLTDGYVNDSYGSSKWRSNWQAVEYVGKIECTWGEGSFEILWCLWAMRAMQVSQLITRLSEKRREGRGCIPSPQHTYTLQLQELRII